MQENSSANTLLTVTRLDKASLCVQALEDVDCDLRMVEVHALASARRVAVYDAVLGCILGRWLRVKYA
jgi:hypothetical protein